MSSEEWERWRAAYEGGGRPLPRIVNAARSDRGRALGGLIGLYGLALFQVVIVVRGLAHARSPLDWGAPVIGLVGTALILGVGHAAMRGTLGLPALHPLDWLDAMERRNAGRQKMLRWLRRLVGVWAIVSLAEAAGRIGIAHAYLQGLQGLAIDVAVLAFVWVATGVMGRKVTASSREISEARRLISDGCAFGDDAGVRRDDMGR